MLASIIPFISFLEATFIHIKVVKAPATSVRLQIHSLGIVSNTGSIISFVLNKGINTPVPSSILLSSDLFTREASFNAIHAPNNNLTIKLSVSVYEETTHSSILSAPTLTTTRLIQGSLTSDLLPFYRHQLTSDIILRVELKDIPAHRVVLMGRSPVFRAMLSNGNSQESVTGIVEIRSLSFVGMSGY